MLWYDLVAPVYDYLSERAYRPYRRILASHLRLAPGQRVLSLACGTGQGFPFLQAYLQGTGQIVGIDYSEGMLARARERVRRHGWTNVTLIRMDARDLSARRLAEHGVDAAFDVVVAELAFSVIPEWQRVMETCWTLLVRGGRFGIMDWYRPRRDLLTLFVNLTAHAQVTRDWVTEAQRLMPDFTVVARGMGGNVLVGIGTRTPRAETS